jgi:hypothetical protein
MKPGGHEDGTSQDELQSTFELQTAGSKQLVCACAGDALARKHTMPSTAHQTRVFELNLIGHFPFFFSVLGLTAAMEGRLRCA